VTLDPPDATSDEAGAPLLDEEYLILSTIHSAKGQEWRSVFVIPFTLKATIPFTLKTLARASVAGHAEMITAGCFQLLVHSSRQSEGNRDGFIATSHAFPIRSA
jgi:hypothetical protein